jgi:hypothetical protein
MASDREPRAYGLGRRRSESGGAVAWGEQATAPVSRDLGRPEGAARPDGPLRRYPES